MLDFDKVGSVPHINPSGEFVLTGQQFAAIWDFLNIFRGAAVALDSAMAVNQAKGNVQIKLVDQNGNSLTKEQENEYYTYMEKQMAEYTSKLRNEKPLS